MGQKPPPKDRESMTVAALEDEIHRHNRLYFEDNAPVISDEDFDRLVRRLRKIKPDSPILHEIPSDTKTSIKGFKKIRREVPMLSLDKCYSEKELYQWAEKFEGDVMGSPKIDGSAVELRYDEKGHPSLAATRGEGIEGEEITENVKRIADIPQKIPPHPPLPKGGQFPCSYPPFSKGGEGGFEIRGEIYMRLSVFRTFDQDFANPRNLAAGALKQKDPDMTKKYHLSFFGYDVLGVDLQTEGDKKALLERLWIPTVPMEVVQKKEMQKFYEKLLTQRETYDFETDGIVFKAFEIKEQGRLGMTAHHPRYAIAYKFQGDSGTTRVKDVEWSVSRTQVLTPVCIVEPVRLSGASVSRASLHNVGLMRQHGLRIGSQVMMVRRGGVIPYLESVIEEGRGAPMTLPEKCPSCGAPTEVMDDFLYCTNKENCFGTRISVLEHFVKAMEIDGFGRKLLERLYETGLVKDPADFYRLKSEDLLDLERMGETLATKLIGNIRARRRLPADQFLRALGIRELAQHASRLLIQHFHTLDRLMEATEGEIAALHSLGEVIAREVVSGLRAKKGLIARLRRSITLIGQQVSQEKKGPLAGLKVCFTGTLGALSRPAAQKKVEEAGGEAVNTITQDLAYLVIGKQGGGGSKLSKAQALQKKGASLQILDEGRFCGLLKG